MKTTSILESSDGPDESLAGAFAALGDPARLAILRELQSGTTCICELAPRLDLAPNLLSYHLRILREAGLVEGARRGRRVEYRVRPQGLEDVTVQLVRLAVRTRASSDETGSGVAPDMRSEVESA